MYAELVAPHGMRIHADRRLVCRLIGAGPSPHILVFCSLWRLGSRPQRPTMSRPHSRQITPEPPCLAPTTALSKSSCLVSCPGAMASVLAEFALDDGDRKKEEERRAQRKRAQRRKKGAQKAAKESASGFLAPSDDSGSDGVIAPVAKQPRVARAKPQAAQKKETAQDQPGGDDLGASPPATDTQVNRGRGRPGKDALAMAAQLAKDFSTATMHSNFYQNAEVNRRLIARWAATLQTKLKSMAPSAEKDEYEIAAKRLSIMETAIKLYKGWSGGRDASGDKPGDSILKGWQSLVQFASSPPELRIESRFMWELRFQSLAIGDVGCQSVAVPLVPPSCQPTSLADVESHQTQPIPSHLMSHNHPHHGHRFGARVPWRSKFEFPCIEVGL